MAMGFDATEIDATVDAGIADIDNALEFIQKRQNGEEVSPVVNDNQASVPQTMPQVQEMSRETLEERHRKLKERLARRAEEKAQEEKQAAKTAEIHRRKSGREMRVAREEFEAKKRAEERALAKAERRKEQEYKASLLAKIDANRRARIEERAANLDQMVSMAPALSTPVPTVGMGVNKDHPMAHAPAPAVSASTLTETTIRVRQTDSKFITRVFSVNDTVRDVLRWAAENRTDGMMGPFDLMSGFPRVVFSGSALDQNLRDAGAVPNGTFIMKPHMF